MLVTMSNSPAPSALSTRRGPYGIVIILIAAGLLLALAACEGRPAPPAPPLTPTTGAIAPGATATLPPAPAPDTRPPDYTPVVGTGGVPYVPPEPWLAAPTLAPGQPTPTPYDGGAAPRTNGPPGQAASPTPIPNP